VYSFNLFNDVSSSFHAVSKVELRRVFMFQNININKHILVLSCVSVTKNVGLDW
jgi:hypothetical protein